MEDLGFDIAHRFDARRVARELGLPILDAPVGILVGNTRALWPRFAEALSADPTLRADPDPIERYTERALGDALFAHRQYDGAYLPFQRIAVAARLGTLSPSQLVIHPIYGPWFALRAIILTDGEVLERAPMPPTCTCTAACTDAFARACASTDWRAWVTVRDACTAGRAYRYGEQQLRYHYSKDRGDLPGDCTDVQV